MLLKIGELARHAGLTVRTLHHYDNIGLLSPGERSDSGFRLYNQADVVRLHRIQALKQFGCSLSEIRAFLAEPEAVLAEIITQQMRVLDEQSQRAQTLRDRLCRLSEQLAKGEETGLTDWLTILELMTMYEKHFSKEELDILRANKAAGNLDVEWSQLVPLVQDAMDRGILPESREAQGLAWRWIRLMRDTTGNDAGLALKLQLIYREEQKTPLSRGITPEMINYITQSFANARDAIFAKTLSPGELENVRSRQAAHGSEWPPLIAEIRQQIQQGAALDDPAVQTLACRWQTLFCESYSGGDQELESRIRSAFQNEPDLLLSVGIDSRLIVFMQGAIQRFQRLHEIPPDPPLQRGAGGIRPLRCDPPGHEGSQENRGNRQDPVPKPTALRVAILRAAHQLLDTPIIFEDPLALRILGAVEGESFRSDPSPYNTPLLKGLRTSVVVRSRLAEDEWARSKQRGIRQYVILGAGLDTYAYRNQDQDNSRIFEVDLPATQQWKRGCLRAAGIREPAFLTFVPINFERSTLTHSLGQAGFCLDEPAFFSWLGVTMYLEEEAIKSTLRFIASLAPTSSVVFDYVVLPSLLTSRERRAMEALSARAAEHGEPWKSFFAPSSLTELLGSLGFSEVDDFGPDQLNDRYLSGREDGLRKSGVSRLVCARV